MKPDLPDQFGQPAALAPHDHWAAHASQWHKIGTPLRPGPDDVALMCRMVHAYVPGQARRGVLLGMTQELWPLGDITGVDRDPAMVDKRKAQLGANGQEILADWRQMPFEADQFDFALGDGSLNTLQYPDGYREVLGQLAKILKPGRPGLFRVFIRPDIAETAADVVRLAQSRQIQGFHAFKWRLAMALCAAHPDISVQAIHAAFQLLVPDRAQFAAATGWAPDLIATIDVYAGSSLDYSFPTLGELRATLGDICSELELAHGHYELAERCPVIALRFGAADSTHPV